MTPETILEGGLADLRNGISVVPVCGKVPNGEWKPCQDALLTPEAFKALLTQNGHGPVTGWAAVLGPATWRRHSFLWILEIEARHRQVAEPFLDERLPGWFDGQVAESGGKSLHVYLLAHSPVSTKVFAWGEIRGKGSVTVRPGSKHVDTGRLYRWLSEGEPLMIDPAGLALPGLSDSRRGYQDLAGGVVHEHEGRNMCMISLTGLLRSADFDMGIIGDVAQVVNDQRCVPPLGKDELTGILNSIGKYPPGTRLKAIIEGATKGEAVDEGRLRLELKVLKNRHLGPAAGSLVELANECEKLTKLHKDDEYGYCPIPAVRIAERLPGIGANTVSRHLAVGVEAELFDIRTETRLEERPDRRTGELRMVPVQHNFYRMPRSLTEQLQLMAQYVGPGRNHGGKRVRCEEHPDAPIVHRYMCSECGKVLKQTTDSVPADLHRHRKSKMDLRSDR